MIRKWISFLLRCRLENVMAAGVSLCLLFFFLSTRLFHVFHFGLLDFLFIFLPVGVLAAKSVLELLFGRDVENVDTLNYLAHFFRPLLRIVRDWFPFLLLSACYYSLYNNLVLRINPHTADALLSRMDAALFGDQPSFLLQPLIRPWITDVLNLVYFSHVIFFPGIALYFYLSGQIPAFRRLMMGYLTLFLMGITSYIFVPAIGPEKFFADRYTTDLHGDPLLKTADYIFRTGHVSFDCFPSLHVGIPLLIALYLRDYRRKWFLPALAYVFLMCCATIYLRYHYVVDVLAAFVFAPAAYFLNNAMLRHWPGERLGEAGRTDEKPPATAPAEERLSP